jgi:adenylate cyclase class 2
MKEIEVKILEIDPKEIVEKLKKLGAKKVGAGFMQVTLVDFPDDRLMAKQSFVRVRTQGDKTTLSLKHMISCGNHKIMEEIETKVDDYETAVSLFDSMGMKIFGKYEKYRATYRLGNMVFDIDKHPSAPWLMEVEAPTEEEVEKGVKMLGYDMSQTTTKNSAEIYASYGLNTWFFKFKEKGESPDYDQLFK